MNYRNINNCTKRQFDAVMKRECITVSDYYDQTITYDVFFRKNNRGTNPQGKVRIFYSQTTPIDKGTTFILKGTPYVVISRDGEEGEVYYTSLAIKCDTSFTVQTDEGFITIPFVTASDKYTLNTGSVVTMVSGNANCYTGLNKYSKCMEINQEFYNYGGYYKVGNYFWNDGLCYIYMTREAMPQDNFTLEYAGDTTSFDMSVTTNYQLVYLALNNLSVIDNPTLTYVSSDENVATVDENGLVTFLEKGTTTITVTWTDGDDTTCTTVLNVGNSAAPTITAELSASSDTIKVGGSYKAISMKIYDADGTDITTDTIENLTASDFVWSHKIDGVEYKDDTSVLTIIAGTTVNGTRVKFANDRSYLEKIMVTTCTCDVLGLSASKDFTISA